MSKMNYEHKHLILSHSDFDRLEVEVLDTLQKNLSVELSYHSVQHTKSVIIGATKIANKENVSPYDLQKIKIAAILHDTGFMFTYQKHEEASCDYARKLLPKYNVSREDIDHICVMIMATKIPQSPNDHCSEILADADLEYLGTNNFNSISSLLYEELKSKNDSLEIAEWNQIQIKFLSAHQYFTQYCKMYRTSIKNKHLQKLKDLIIT